MDQRPVFPDRAADQLTTLECCRLSMLDLHENRVQFFRTRRKDGVYFFSTNDPDGAVRLALTAPFIAADIETGSAVSERRWEIKAFSISDGEESFVLDPARHEVVIRAVLTHARRLVFHNAPYDVPALYRAGLMTVRDVAKVYDTLVTARIAFPDSTTASNSLGPLAGRLLGEDPETFKGTMVANYRSTTGRSAAATYDELTLDTSPAYATYAAHDTWVTAQVYRVLPGVLRDALNPGLPSFEAADSEYLDRREQAVNRLLLRRSCLGIRLDDEAGDSVVDELRARADEHSKVLLDAGVDPAQSGAALKRQLVDTLDRAGELPESWPTLKNGSRTASQTWLDRLEDHPWCRAAVELARANRFIKDYQGGAANLAGQSGRIHPQVSVQVARTGRMSYTSPSLQQWPQQVRRMLDFERPATSFDWTSIEPYLAALLARETDLIETYEAGGDLYMPVAERAGVGRKTAKTVLLALLYGQGAPSLALRLRMPEQEARAVQYSVRQAMPKVTNLVRRVSAYGNLHGSIQTISGRLVTLDRNVKTGNETFHGYKAINYLIQGSAYDLLAEVLYRCEVEGLGDDVLLAMHDELVVHTDVADEIDRLMRTAPDALVESSGHAPRLRVGRTDLGTHWSAKE